MEEGLEMRLRRKKRAEREMESREMLKKRKEGVDEKLR